jgi:hypothetical protein
VRIFQLVAAPSKVCKRPETLSELGSDHALYGIVTSAGSSAQALLCHERDAGEPCGVVGHPPGAQPELVPRHASGYGGPAGFQLPLVPMSGRTNYGVNGQSSLILTR